MTQWSSGFPEYMAKLTRLHFFTEEQLESDAADQLRDELLALWRKLPRSEEFLGRLLSRTLNHEVTWKCRAPRRKQEELLRQVQRYQEVGAISRAIETLEERRVGCTPRDYWPLMFDLWGATGLPETYASCGVHAFLSRGDSRYLAPLRNVDDSFLQGEAGVPLMQAIVSRVDFPPTSRLSAQVGLVEQAFIRSPYPAAGDLQRWEDSLLGMLDEPEHQVFPAKSERDRAVRARAWALIGNLRMTSGAAFKAIPAYEAAVDLTDRNAEGLHFLKGLAAAEAGNLDLGEEIATRLLALDGHRSQGHFIRGIVAFKRQQYSASLAEFEAGLESGQDLSVGATGLEFAAYAAFQAGSDEKASNYLRKAIALQPDWSHLREQLVRLERDHILDYEEGTRTSARATIEVVRAFLPPQDSVQDMTGALHVSAIA